MDQVAQRIQDGTYSLDSVQAAVAHRILQSGDVWEVDVKGETHYN